MAKSTARFFKVEVISEFIKIPNPIDHIPACPTQN